MDIFSRSALISPIQDVVVVGLLHRVGMFNTD